MSLLLLGLVIWYTAHLAKRLAPGLRATLQDNMGDASKGVFAVLLLLSVVLMTLGYRSYVGDVFWTRSAMLVGINNLLMVLAVYLFASSGLRTRITGVVRHPQLTGFKLWAFAHLLVNGDTASFVLFGGLLVWAVIEVIVINRQTDRPTLPDGYPASNELKAVVGTIVVFAVISLVHAWLGYSPFGA